MAAFAALSLYGAFPPTEARSDVGPDSRVAASDKRPRTIKELRSAAIMEEQLTTFRNWISVPGRNPRFEKSLEELFERNPELGKMLRSEIIAYGELRANIGKSALEIFRHPGTPAQAGSLAAEIFKRLGSNKFVLDGKSAEGTLALSKEGELVQAVLVELARVAQIFLDKHMPVGSLHSEDFGK